jgi:TonB-dependent receptor
MSSSIIGRLRRASLWLSLGVALAPSLAWADPAPELNGRVTDSTGSHGFQGARVRVVELGRSIATDADGRFHLDALAPGTYTLAVDYVGAPEVRRTVTVGTEPANITIPIGADVRTMDNVLVIGYAAGQASAINQQRNADNFRNVVSADGIGQFPDQNVTEAVQRLPGVSIARDQGEGRFIVVRGIDPNLNAVSIGGVRVPSAEKDARQVALDVIPSELISGIEVNKTLTPDMDGDGIGASINVKTLSAFDRGNGMHGSGKLEGGYNTSRSRWSPKGGFSFSDTFDAGGDNNLGLAIGGSWQKRYLGTDGEETKDGFVRREAPDGSEYRIPERLSQRRYEVERDRKAATANVDWIVSDSTSVYLHTLFSDFRDNEDRQQSQYRFDKGDVATLDAEGGTFTGGRIDKQVKLRVETQRIQSYALGGQTMIDPWTIDYELAWSKADEAEKGHIEAEFQGKQDIGIRNPLGTRPTAYPLDADTFADPDTYAFDKLTIDDSQTTDVERSARLDLRRELDLSSGSAFIKFGGKLRRRSKDTNPDTYTWEYDGDDDLPLTGFVRPGVDWGFGDFGPGIAAGPVRDYVGAGLPGAVLNQEDTEADSRGGDFDMRENIDAGYLMGGYETGNWHWVGGARVERTDFTAHGVRVLADDTSDEVQFLPVSARKRYTDVLPQLNLRYDLSPQSLLRAAVTRSVARANFGDLSPGSELSVERDDDGNVERREISTGNPLLDPYRSDNIDLAWEYYPSGLGALTAGVFYKHIRNYVVNVDLAGRGAYADYDKAETVVNGDSAKLYGLELSWTRKFENGFLLNTNATLSHSKATLGLREGGIPLPNQSKLLANLVLGYERGPLTLRLSNAWLGKRLIAMDDPADAAQDIYEQGHLQVDLSTKWRLAKGWRAYAEVVNLTDRPYAARYGSGGLLQYEKYGRVYNLGVEASF